jgi:hypothetical protein
MGQVVSCKKEARDPSGHHVIQVVDVDDERSAGSTWMKFHMFFMVSMDYLMIDN